MVRFVRLVRRSPAIVLSAALAATGCSETAPDPAPLPGPTPIAYPAFGSTSAASGKGSFRFGAASAATQIEDQNTTTDWYLWTQPPPEGLGEGEFVGDAADGYTMAIEDVDLLAEMHLDSYRFSIEWARVEPQKDQIDEAALAHYDALIDALVSRGIRPMVTIHHFSNPVWVDDPRDKDCAGGSSDQNFCGWNDPVGGPAAAAELGEHARLLAERFGDRVDDWCTLNEPINYLLASYGIGQFPPGKSGILDPLAKFVPTVRNFLAAHVAAYRALKEADTIDADGDGVAASVGLTKEAGEWIAARDNLPSTDPADLAGRDRLLWVYQYLFVDALREGAFDTDLDGTLDEPHPEWKSSLDWIGVQYYFRAGVTAANGIVPVLGVTPCLGSFNAGACVPPLDPTYMVPAMGYEQDPAGIHAVLTDFGARWPDLPMTVTESGIATLVGARRAELIVRSLESIELARSEGVDVRGYYHWSLCDNFEWAEGFTPRFGLYTVDYGSFARTATEGATVLGAIAGARELSAADRERYGGSGPMTAEP